MSDQSSNKSMKSKAGHCKGVPSYDKVDSIIETDTLCCCPPACAPSWLQFLANPKLFVFHMMVVVSFTMMAFVYIGAVLTTIERNFRLDSAQSGAITISADIVSTLFIIPLSHYGQMGHRPRWIGTGMILTAIGTFICAMPHFVSDPVDPKTILTGSVDEVQDMCIDGQDNAAGVPSNVSGGQDELGDQGYSKGDLTSVWWLILGQVLSGIGHAPFVPLVITYIDDSVKKHNLTAYTAVLFTAFTFGPSCGFLFGALTTSLYVDFDRITPDQIPDINQNDPRWIGAWWLGFVILGTILLILSIPIFFYPRTMSSAVRKWKQEKERAEADDDQGNGSGMLLHAGGPNGMSPVEVKDKRDEADDDDDLRERRDSIYTTLDVSAVETVIKGPLRALKRLLTNPTNMFLVLDETAFVSLIAIFSAFGVKTMQVEYSISPSEGALIIAMVIGPANILGNIFSAIICRRFKLNSKQCTLFVLICTIIGLLGFPFAMNQGCANVPIAGVTTPYDQGMADPLESLFTSNGCNEQCACSDEVFKPVCGSNGLTYLSPCHAGCQGVAPSDDVTVVPNPLTAKLEYTSCNCIRNHSSFYSNSTFFSSTADIDVPDAIAGQCPSTNCNGPVVMAILLALMFFMLSACKNPTVYVALRCVREEDRSMALALRSVSSHFLGFFPAPIYFGAIINSVCLHWQVTDGVRGSCFVYDNRKYELAFFGTAMALQSVSVIAVTCMYLSIDEKLRNKKSRLDSQYEKVEKHDIELDVEKS